jgi:hemoglobin
MNQFSLERLKGADQRMRKTLFAVTIAAALALGVMGVPPAQAQGGAMMSKSGKPDSLYKRLGGKNAITAVVNEFVNIVAADTRINGFFAETVKDPKRVEKLKKNLIDQICQASGGPCKYKGKDMKTAHKGMGVSEADFNALVEDLVKALDKFNVGATEKNELLGALGPMKGDIVER